MSILRITVCAILAVAFALTARTPEANGTRSGTGLSAISRIALARVRRHALAFLAWRVAIG